MPPRGHNESSAQRDTEDTRHRHCAPCSFPASPPNGLRRQTCRRGFAIHEKPLDRGIERQREEEGELCRGRHRNSLEFAIKRYGVNQE